MSVAVEEVTVTPNMTTLKLRIEGCAGRVSATKVKLRLAWPPPLQLTVQTTLFGPLHEESVRAASKRAGRNKRVLLRFMRHPTTDKSAFSIPRSESFRNTHIESSVGRERKELQDSLACSSIK